ncbi:hypothetical protein SAMN05192560_2044 [Methylobacillus rhizosphaerae]|uniref:Beta/Gamma crystallin n=1 Tax=Methylobacillus rhizosphaerae TaxID=551994 RepID=A0A239ANT4_9PROT|nr:hypothetical protein [Methylobacillus rhizosphaerae]SNR97307.1 hypothetical protein SAMN05192560_2044 [Methylobacillus rhizosphaerae]
MKWFAMALSTWLLVFASVASASPYADKQVFEEDARQGILKEQSSRDHFQFRGLIVTEFDDSLNLCGEMNKSDEPEWTRFIKVFDKGTERFELVWIEPGDAASEVEDFKKDQFGSYWDRRCSSLR